MQRIARRQEERRSDTPKNIKIALMQKTKKQAAIGFIFITMLIDITGWGIIIPVIPKLIKELIHGEQVHEYKVPGACQCFE